MVCQGMGNKVPPLSRAQPLGNPYPAVALYLLDRCQKGPFNQLSALGNRQSLNIYGDGHAGVFFVKLLRLLYCQTTHTHSPFSS